MSPSQEIISIAHQLADVSGAVVRKHFRAGLDAEDKADKSPVTAADREVESAIRDILAALLPDHGIIGEELGRTHERAEFVWVIDPIDGTKAFLTGRPTFGTLIALLRRGRPILGVIDQPIVGDRWLGVTGAPTLHNGRPVRARACPSLARARLSTSGPQYFSAAGRRAFDAVAERVHFTTYGGDCYQYGLVALGGIDVVVESGLKLHDYAALVPVVTGAGGLFTDWRGRAIDVTRGDASSSGDVVAAGDARVHAEVIAILRAAAP